jgi:LmbE family N-acetylglucosaminyl deacetylase
MNQVALAFLAHPDDAEILCAGTLIRLRQLGWDVHIATCTPGDLGTVSRDSWAISALRTQEAKAAAEKIGAYYHCLDERDGYVIYDRLTLKKAYDLFRRLAPSLVFTHATHDYMVDHEQASLIARSASFVYSAPNASAFPVMPGSQIPYLYYCDPLEGIDPLGQPVTPTTLVDISSVIEQKAAMLACHASQREWLAAHHGMDEYIESMKRLGKMRGHAMGVAYAEGFVQHRGHAYPGDDMLRKVFAGFSVSGGQG